MKKERKSNLLTIRLTNDEKSVLDLLTDSMDKSKSDVMLRACKYFTSVGGDGLGGNLGGSLGSGREGKGTDEREKMVCQVHVRMTDADMETLRTQSNDSGVTISQLVRESIKAFSDVMRGSY